MNFPVSREGSVFSQSRDTMKLFRNGELFGTAVCPVIVDTKLWRRVSEGDVEREGDGFKSVTVHAGAEVTVTRERIMIDGVKKSLPVKKGRWHVSPSGRFVACEDYVNEVWCGVVHDFNTYRARSFRNPRRNNATEYFANDGYFYSYENSSATLYREDEKISSHSNIHYVAFAVVGQPKFLSRTGQEICEGHALTFGNPGTLRVKEDRLFFEREEWVYALPQQEGQWQISGDWVVRYFKGRMQTFPLELYDAEREKREEGETKRVKTV